MTHVAKPRGIRAAGALAAAVLIGFLPNTRADDDAAEPAVPQAAAEAGADSPSPFDDETVTDQPPGVRSGTAEPMPPPPPRFRHPQPSLRHATPRYEASYNVPAGDAALLRRLEEPLPPGGILLVEQATLLDLEDWLSQRAKLPVRLDWRAFEEMGLDAETSLPVNQVEGGGLRAALTELLDGIDLTVIVKHGALTITTKETAEANLVIGFYPLPTQITAGNLQPLIDLIQSTVAADTWDTVGGPGAIRAAEEANSLAITQTYDKHAEILALMRQEFDADLVPDAARAAGQVPTRVYGIRAASLAAELETGLVAMCNAALGEAGDPRAKVTRLAGDRLVVQSASRPFHIYAAELIRAANGIDGVAELPLEPGARGRVAPEGILFCWVAREVYGPGNPRWLAFRGWLLGEAPVCLRDGYAAHGERLAAWVRTRPLAKACLRTLMDAALAGRRPPSRARD